MSDPDGVDRPRAGPSRRGALALVGAAIGLVVGAISWNPSPASVASPSTATRSVAAANEAHMQPAATRRADASDAANAANAVSPRHVDRPTRGFTNAGEARFHVPILMYHLVGGADDPDALPSLVVPAPLFAAQLTALHAHGWRTMPLATLATDLLTDQPPPPRCFVITLDDGHADGYTTALPILRQLGDTATFFVITDRIGRTGYLSAPDLRTLVLDGMEIGNHTVSHPDLARLNAAAARGQIDDAQTALAAILGVSPVVLAYPSGEANPAVETDAAAAGIELAVGNQPGVLETLRDRFLVPRVRVSPGLTPIGLLAEMNAAGSAQ